jgi:hypothetical protein
VAWHPPQEREVPGSNSAKENIAVLLCIKLLNMHCMCVERRNKGIGHKKKIFNEATVLPDHPFPTRESVFIFKKGCNAAQSSRDRCYDFLNIFAKIFSEKIGVFDSKQSQILKKMIITLVF